MEGPGGRILVGLFRGEFFKFILEVFLEAFGVCAWLWLTGGLVTFDE